jgi:beta-lactamase superfamily II metal-dependent hydrolase
VTSLPVTEGSPSPVLPSSEGLSIDIYLFHCGHGDTILVRLPGDRWGLIDCFLPEQFGIRENFFKFIKDKDIKTFDFIFQTHPHYDHYHGMQAVIEHFLESGEKIGDYIDTGLNAQRARDLLQNRPGAAEYGTLQDRLEELDEAKRLKLYDLGVRSIPYFPKGFRGQIEFVPIGPDPGEKRRIISSDLRKLVKNSRARLEANKLSLIIVLSANIDNCTLGVLLGADAGIKEIHMGIDHWKQYCRDMSRVSKFDVIKIPHHGSIESHAPDLCRMRRSGSGAETAVVSAGTRRALPDKKVLGEYLLNGWSVMTTTTRGSSSAPSLPMALANRGTADERNVLCHTIRLSWNPSSGLSAEPAAAKIGISDLDHYETAEG